MMGCIAVTAQCTINTANTTPGITAVNPNDSLTQGVVYGQTFQVYIPDTFEGHAIDSVHVAVTGSPAGLTVVYLPAGTGGATIAGGGHGAICFAGATFDAVGAYPLTFIGNVYAGSITAPLDSLPATFSYTFYVEPPGPQGYICDTVMNVNPAYDDTLIVPLDSPNVGYLSGNGGINNPGQYFPFMGIGEKLTGGMGDSVTGAMVEFGYVTITPTDSNKQVGIYVYNDNGPLGNGALTGGPGAALDSAFLSFKTIAADVQNQAFSNVMFAGRPGLTSPGFFIVVKLPTIPGDTVVIFTNDASTTNGAGYLAVNNTWYAYTTLLHLTADSLGNFIGATLCGNEPNAPQPGFDVTPADICLGTTATFNNVTLGSPSSFNWSFGDGSPASTLMNPVHTYADTGVYLVSLVASNAGGSETYSTYLTVFANPLAIGAITNASSLTTADGMVLVTVTSGAPPYTFVWSNGTSGDTLSAVYPGTYEVTVTDSNTCVVVDTFTVSYTSGIGILNGDVQVKIYPNPASRVIFAQSAQSAITGLEIIDALGRRAAITEGNSNSCSLEVGALASGNYLLLVHTADGIVTKPITILRNSRDQ